MKPTATALISAAVLGLNVAAVNVAWADTTPSSSPPSECHGSFSAYEYTRAALEECGIATYPATVTTLRGGGHLYSYYAPDGSLFAKTALPPTGFDPMGADAAQLAEYGYPPRPAGAAEMAGWERLVSVPRSTPEPFMPNLAGFGFSASRASSNWSGYITKEGGFTYSEADYTEPSFNNSVCGESAAVTWAGIGGGPNATEGSALFQDGTAHSNNYSIGFSNHQPWWEIATGESSTAQAFPQGGTAAPGDSMTAIANDESEPGYVSFTVVDYTSNKTWQDIVARKGATPKPATAEMIAERPKINKKLAPHLSDFGTLYFNSDEADQETIEHWLTSFSTEFLYMTAGGKAGERWLAYPSEELGQYGGFTDTWYNCS
jgi:hypothetical protein